MKIVITLSNSFLDKGRFESSLNHGHENLLALVSHGNNIHLLLVNILISLLLNTKDYELCKCLKLRE